MQEQVNLNPSDVIDHDGNISSYMEILYDILLLYHYTNKNDKCSPLHIVFFKNSSCSLKGAASFLHFTDIQFRNT
jgi:hypothetical protein